MLLTSALHRLWSGCQLNQIHFLPGEKQGCGCSRALPCLAAQGKRPALSAISSSVSKQPWLQQGHLRHQDCTSGTAHPVQKHQRETFLYLRDHFTADTDCFQVISVIIINKIPNLPFVNNEEAAGNCWMHAHASAFGLTKASELHGSSTDTSKQENSY